MANYNAKFLTNYFSVTDAIKFKNIIGSCHADDEIEIYEKKQLDGSIKYSFGCIGIIYGISENDDDCEEDIELFYTSLQSIITSDDAIIITEIGNEKLNYFTACCIIITCDDIKSIDVRNEAVKLAATMLKTPDFTTQMDY